MAQTVAVRQLVLAQIQNHNLGVAIEGSSRCNSILGKVDLAELGLSKAGQLSNLVN